MNTRCKATGRKVVRRTWPHLQSAIPVRGRECSVCHRLAVVLVYFVGRFSNTEWWFVVQYCRCADSMSWGWDHPTDESVQSRVDYRWTADSRGISYEKHNSQKDDNHLSDANEIWTFHGVDCRSCHRWFHTWEFHRYSVVRRDTRSAIDRRQWLDAVLQLGELCQSTDMSENVHYLHRWSNEWWCHRWSAKNESKSIR